MKFWQIGTPYLVTLFGRLETFVSLYFRQIGTPCFIVFLTDWKTLFHCIFGRVKHPVSLAFLADWNTLFHCNFGTLKHLVSLYFFTDYNTLFHKFGTHLFFDILEHFFITFSCRLQCKNANNHNNNIHKNEQWYRYLLTKQNG